MNKSDSIKNIAKALCSFQSEIKNPTNSAKNPYFNSKYAPLNEILSDSRPLLSKYGISIIQNASSDGTNSSITITTMILHDSGEWIESDPLVLKTDKCTAQGAGSAITYARRYALSSILGIASEDDDDGNNASGNQSKSPETKVSSSRNTKNKSSSNATTENSTTLDEVITISQAHGLFKITGVTEDVIRKVVSKYGYDSTKKIKVADYEKIREEILEEVSVLKKGAWNISHSIKYISVWKSWFTPLCN